MQEERQSILTCIENLRPHPARKSCRRNTSHLRWKQCNTECTTVWDAMCVEHVPRINNRCCWLTQPTSHISCLTKRTTTRGFLSPNVYLVHFVKAHTPHMVTLGCVNDKQKPLKGSNHEMP